MGKRGAGEREKRGNVGVVGSGGLRRRPEWNEGMTEYWILVCLQRVERSQWIWGLTD